MSIEENICKVVDGVPHIYSMEKIVLSNALKFYINELKKQLDEFSEAPTWMSNIVRQGLSLAEVVKSRLDAMPEVPPPKYNKIQ